MTELEAWQDLARRLERSRNHWCACAWIMLAVYTVFAFTLVLVVAR